MTSVSTRRAICQFCAPSAFISPSSWLRSITLAVMRFEMARAEPMELRIVIRTIRSVVLFRIVPSDSATCRTGRATPSRTTSWIWWQMALT